MDETIEKESLCLIAAQKLLDRSMDFHFLKGNGKSPVSKFGFYLIPNHWNVLKTSEFASVEYGISKSVASNTDPSIGWQIITGANISLDGKFDLEKKRYIEPPDKERFLLNRGDLLFNWRSGSPEHIGKTAIFDLDGDYTYASFVLRIRCGDKTINRYMFYLFNYLRKIEFFTNLHSYNKCISPHLAMA
jgi:type I restriction enzyme S subunit